MMNLCASTVTSGDICTITCEVEEGNPPSSTISWMFQRKFSDEIINLNNPQEQYSFAATKDSAGKYFCQAQNEAGMSSLVGEELLVQCKFKKL